MVEDLAPFFMASKSSGSVEVRRKVVLVGFRGVGKSSLAKQFTEGNGNDPHDLS